MTPDEWNLALAESVHWKTAYQAVAGEVRAMLDLLKPEPPLTTAQLVEALWPSDAVLGSNPLVSASHHYARRRIFKALAALADHDLSDWCEKDIPHRNRFGKIVTPLRWRCPAPKVPYTCPHCGGEL